MDIDIAGGSISDVDGVTLFTTLISNVREIACCHGRGGSIS